MPPLGQAFAEISRSFLSKDWGTVLAGGPPRWPIYEQVAPTGEGTEQVPESHKNIDM